MNYFWYNGSIRFIKLISYDYAITKMSIIIELIAYLIVII